MPPKPLSIDSVRSRLNYTHYRLCSLYKVKCNILRQCATYREEISLFNGEIQKILIETLK